MMVVIIGMFGTDILGKQFPLEVCHWRWEGQELHPPNKCPTGLFKSDHIASWSFLTEADMTSSNPAFFTLN